MPLLNDGDYVLPLFVCLFVCLSTRLLKKLLPVIDFDEIFWRGCLRNNRLDSGGNPDYNLDPGFWIWKKLFEGFFI